MCTRLNVESPMGASQRLVAVKFYKFEAHLNAKLSKWGHIIRSAFQLTCKQ